MTVEKKLAIISTHPIQYNAPFFRMLTGRNVIKIKVFYTWSQVEHNEKYDPGFKQIIDWDIPLLDGYDYIFINNTAARPGSDHFFGIDNPTLIDEIKQWQPDAVMVFGWSFKSHLKVIRHFKGKRKLLFRGDSTLVDEPVDFSFKKILRRFFLKWVYSNIDAALYTGELNKQYFQKHGLKTNQLIFAPHTVENERFFQDEMIVQTAAGLRKKFKISDTDTVFLFAGKLEGKKQPGLLIEAFKKLQYANVHLLIVGSGVLLKDLIKQAGDLPGIHFMDFQNQSAMPSIYAVCDIFVLPSIGPGETWGLSVNEAMASGKAIIVSDRCGCAPDLVENALNGYIFKAGSEIDLQEKMELILDAKCSKVMGNRSLEKIKNWNYQYLCKQVENTLIV